MEARKEKRFGPVGTSRPGCPESVAGGPGSPASIVSGRLGPSGPPWPNDFFGPIQKLPMLF